MQSEISRDIFFKVLIMAVVDAQALVATVQVALFQICLIIIVDYRE
jgi:hypothetical protein